MAPSERTLSSLAVVTILLLYSSPSFTRADREDFSDRKLLQTYLERTLNVVEKTLYYVGRHIEKLNLDGLIGVRDVESRFSVLIAYLWPALPPNIVRKVRDLTFIASTIGGRSEEIVRRTTPKYYAKSFPIIKEHFWDLMFPDRAINSSLIRILHDEDRQSVQEKASDDCLAELYGVEGRVRCKISRTCWTMMTGKKYKYYSLTHELFYLMNGIHASCQSELNEAAQKYGRESVPQLMDFFCANIYSEALMIEKEGFKVELMDLFMEQIGLCGEAGYMEIAKWKWLPRILSFQRRNGCFGTLPGEKISPLNFDPKGYGKSKRSFAVQKRVEQLMSSDGCLSHRISVALSALSTYVRRLMQHLARERN